MSELKVSGTIKVIGEVQTFDSGFKKVEFVVTTDEKYPQDIKLEIIQDKVDNFVKFNKVGDSVDVKFNLRGNLYNEKYYVNLQAWDVRKVDSAQTAPTEENGAQDDGLPF